MKSTVSECTAWRNKLLSDALKDYPKSDKTWLEEVILSAFYSGYEFGHDDAEFEYEEEKNDGKD
jgi:hypothetical protein